jgi:aminoglycoside phosphotransferase
MELLPDARRGLMGTPEFAAQQSRTRIPTPPGRNVLWEPPRDMTHPLSAFQENFVLSACPLGTRILSAHFHRQVRLPCPIWVRVILPNGEEETLILRMDYALHGVEHEAAVLPVLARLGLPVPAILAGPVFDPTQLEAGAMTILSVLPGRDLLGWTWDAPPADVELALRLVLEGVERLHALTEALSREPVARQLVKKTLLSELQEVVTVGGPWFDEPVFRQAVDMFLPIVASIQTPLAFSSGDYNQGNFLFDGQALTGFIDFTGACFEDPHVGMAMYWIYSWYPLDRAGIVERYLEKQGLSFVGFAPRLAVRCLSTLQQRIAVTGGEDVREEDDYESHAEYRERILNLLKRAVS